MLVLSRKMGESIVIGDNIQVFVLDSSGDSVKLGITAPREIPIYRLEVLNEVISENKKAQSPKVALALPQLISKAGIGVRGQPRRPLTKLAV